MTVTVVGGQWISKMDPQRQNVSEANREAYENGGQKFSIMFLIEKHQANGG
jgi:hypothetical protein